MKSNNTAKSFDYTGLKRVISLGLSQSKGLFIGVIFIAVFSACFSVYRPYLTGDVIDNYILNKDLVGLKLEIFKLIILLIFEGILAFFTVYLANVVAQRVIKELRVRLYNHLIKFKLGYFDRTPNGVLVTRSVSDVETIAEVFNDGILVLLGDALKIIFIVAMMYYMNWVLATIVIVILPLMMIITRYFQKALKDVYQEERTLVSKLNTFIQERLTGMNIIQVFNRQQAEYSKFSSINNDLKKNYLKTVLYFSLLFPVVDIVSALATGSLIWFGGLRTAAAGDVTVGNLIAFTQFITMLTAPMRAIAERFNSIQRGLVGADRVFDILDANETLPNNGKKKLEKVKGKIDFENVEFSYVPNNKVLKGISFSSQPGETIAIVGATGAGKSTIINLLSRFYDIDSGSIKIDGIDIYDMDLVNLRHHVAVVLQDVFLFNTTIFDNIILGDKSITLEQVQEAAKVIGIHDFISSLPNGYYSEVSERGSTLSVGQRQLISFLRAYIYNPEILVLDEATSSIDSNSEELIQLATTKLTEGRTSIVIAHRLATIQNADQIIVMDNGMIVEKGTHESLLAKNGYYANLYEVQFSKMNS
ncbi:ABC transporter ATP-binding protein [Faecalibacter rhinopitheci]|uniref:ABC transporter ATP-binding protein n=1 Tax=Faecalibacter rhinopitheci TaxID=2779678 RepID=A0A8J7FSL2_9FLAO|nr:ABC transporter ATP-binding protein [Faecalibacter rhinopitheci]MBF0598093.1 ABC transporter ATP-binding protein [Faecalibacter rhinopitheci]MBQ0148108.1 ABC transporter ATP-binding protein [Candidatus Onthonaster equi]